LILLGDYILFFPIIPNVREKSKAFLQKGYEFFVMGSVMLWGMKIATLFSCIGA